MVRRQQPDSELELLHYDADDGAAEVRQPRPPDRSPAFVRIEHPNGGGLVTVIAFTDDRERWKRAIIGATDARGVFDVQVRNKGQAILWKDTVEVARDSMNGTQPAAPAPSGFAQPPLAQSAPDAGAQLVSNVREVFNLAKDMTPAAPPALPVTLDDVRNVVAQQLDGAISRLAEALKPVQQQQQGDQLDMVERVIELQKRLAPPQQQQPQQQGDEFERVLTLFDRVEQIRERAGEGRGESDNSFLGKASNLLDTLGRNAGKLAPLAPLLTPMLPGRMQALLAGQGDAPPAAPAEAQPQGQQQPAPAAQPQNAAEAFQLVLTVAVADLTRNKRPGRLADLIEESAARFPDLAPTINELIEAPAVQVLQLLEARTGRADLIGLGHSQVWVEALQDELRGDEDEDAAQVFEPHAGNNNGTAKAAAN